MAGAGGNLGGEPLADHSSRRRIVCVVLSAEAHVRGMAICSSRLACVKDSFLFSEPFAVLHTHAPRFPCPTLLTHIAVSACHQQDLSGVRLRMQVGCQLFSYLHHFILDTLKRLNA